MTIVMAELKKKLGKLDARVDELAKSETFTDGAVENAIKQLQNKSGSGTTGNVPEHTMTEGTFNDGAQKKGVERMLPQKAGSGAAVGEKFANTTNQTGRMFNDGAVDKEEMIKAKGKTIPATGNNKKGKGEGPADPKGRAQKSGVPAATGGDKTAKTTTSKK